MLLGVGWLEGYGRGILETAFISSEFQPVQESRGLE